MKVISETLGHARSSFTSDTYTSVLPEVALAAAGARVVLFATMVDGYWIEAWFVTS